MPEMTWQRERLEHNRLARAQRGDEDAFAQLTEPYRRELQLHCYRIVGSLQDAEDLLQETLLAAWRGLEQFEGRSSLRAWLYTIATNRCLNAVRDRERRPQAAPGDRGGRDGVPPPRQRAVLVLRDVLGFHAEEVADMLGSSEASVNSALQRARGTLEKRLPPRQERLTVPSGGADADMVNRFADAFQRDDIDAVVAMLTEDAVISMPPEPEWHQGRHAIERFLRDRHGRRRDRAWRFVRLAANLQPAYAFYLETDAEWVRSGMFVLGVRPDGIESITRFQDNGLLDRFGAPPHL
jgi:RNA polymerase sigma-70 factor (ECF subfamily)